MARQASRYVCQECGAVFPKWSGRCDACGAWNAIVEEEARPAAPRGLGAGRGKTIELVSLAGSDSDPPRLACGIAEFDRVTGGGMVDGSALLIGGDPGIGKSTMLLQVAGGARRYGAGGLHLGRGGDGPDSIARPAARARRGPGGARRRDQRPRHRRHPGERRAAAGGSGRFDPDHVCGHAGVGARYGRPGSRQRAGVDPAREAPRLLPPAGRTRHQGRFHRGSACARTHGRWRVLFRRQERP